MSHVDLSLAASYVPGFTCMFKLLVLTLMANFFLEHGALTALVTLVLLDRLLIEPMRIFDGNLVLAYGLALTTVGHMRAEAYLHTPLMWVPVVGWVCVALVQSYRPLIHYEVPAVAVLCCLLSFTHTPIETVVFSAARVLVWGGSVMVYCYTDPSEPLYVIMLRIGFIMLVHIALALPLGCLCAVLVFMRTGVKVDSDVEAQLLRDALAKHKGSA